MSSLHPIFRMKMFPIRLFDPTPVCIFPYFGREQRTISNSRMYFHLAGFYIYEWFFTKHSLGKSFDSHNNQHEAKLGVTVLLFFIRVL
jgi:hypothetical protein